VLGQVRFQALRAGNPQIRLHSATGRDKVNHGVPIRIGETIALPSIPLANSLSFASPNPFSGSTAIGFALAQAGPVELVIYDIGGRRVRTLVREARAPGEYHEIWDGRGDQGGKASAGVYFARLNVGGSVFTRSMVLVK
jgi:hypothetical protein